MSSNLTLSATQIALLNQAYVRPARKLGDLIPVTVVAERHQDTLRITQHPVEKGAVIADHAIKEPATLTLEYRWSESGSSLLLNGNVNADVKTPAEVYEQLLALQAAVELVDVYTGKRVYQNMALVGIKTDTDKHTENILAVTISCQQVILATAQTLVLTTQSSATNAATPEATAPVVNQGLKQLKSAPLFTGTN